MTETQKLLAEVETFLVKNQIAHTTFSLNACGTFSAVARLRAGLGCNAKRIDQLRAYMRDYEPTKKKRERRSESVAA